MDDRRTLVVIARARALRPGKALTEVINTHHHFDHSGGIRAAVSEGLRVITHESNRGFFEAMVARPATVSTGRACPAPTAAHDGGGRGQAGAR